MSISGFYRRFATEGPRGIFEHGLYAFLFPLAFLYGLVGFVRVLCYRLGWLASYRASVPVVSIGNLAVGGTGKTPTVDLVLKAFLAEGHRVAVVSRGYGSKSGKGVRVVSSGTGPLLPVDLCGDEPYLLARRNPKAVVIVSRRRKDGVRVAVEQHGAEVVLLDDGFQHLAVQRDLDVVLLDARRPFGNGQVMPAGLLREFVFALRRGDLFLLTRCTGHEPDPDLPGPLFHSRHVLSDELASLDGQRAFLHELKGKSGAAFAGIAEPVGFFQSLQCQGHVLAHTLSFVDHAGYGSDELERLHHIASQVDYLVTTEKDGVKLAGVDFDVPCYQVPMTLDVLEGDRFIREIKSHVLPLIR